ncbi:MAG: hypothetical protein HRU11_05350 [Parvularculaceae bacterium]|nr:hypothetical protein [Parvularculaceae bacterium]
MALVPTLSAAHELSHHDDDHGDEVECELCLVLDRLDDDFTQNNQATIARLPWELLAQPAAVASEPRHIIDRVSRGPPARR